MRAIRFYVVQEPWINRFV